MRDREDGETRLASHTTTYHPDGSESNESTWQVWFRGEWRDGTFVSMYSIREHGSPHLGSGMPGYRAFWIWPKVEITTSRIFAVNPIGILVVKEEKP